MLNSGRGAFFLTTAAIVLTGVWLVYSNLQLANTVAKMQAQDYTGTLEIGGPNVSVRFNRDSGAGRPFVDAPGGVHLVEYTDWDANSSILVDGARKILYLHPHGYAVDKEKRRIFHSIQGEGWELLKEISAGSDDTVKVDFFFIARKLGIEKVKLSVAHYNWYFQQVARSEQGFLAAVSDLPRRDIEAGEKAIPLYKVSVTAGAGLDATLAEPVRIAGSSQWGVSSIVTEFALTRPVRDQRTTLASESISWSRYPTGTADSAASGSATIMPSAAPTATTLVAPPTGSALATAPSYLIVSTGGAGGVMRADARGDAAIVSILNDGTRVTLQGTDVKEGNRTWRRVGSPDGKLGWMDAAILAMPLPTNTEGYRPAPTPASAPTAEPRP